MTTWQNADGLQVRFGGFHADPAERSNKAASVVNAGARKEIVVDFDLTLLGADGVSFTSDLNNDGTKNGFNSGDTFIPAGASVESCKVIMNTAAAGGTSLAVGTHELDGTAIAPYGLVTPSNGATANLTVGTIVTGSGADIGEHVHATKDGYVSLTVAGTFTAGTGRVVITYIDAPGT